MLSAQFWTEAGERAVKTFAQVLVAMFTVGVTVLSVDWVDALAVSGTAALVSILTSVASVGFGQPDTPSLAGGGYTGRHRA